MVLATTPPPPWNSWSRPDREGWMQVQVCLWRSIQPIILCIFSIYIVPFAAFSLRFAVALPTTLSTHLQLPHLNRASDLKTQHRELFTAMMSGIVFGSFF